MDMDNPPQGDEGAPQGDETVPAGNAQDPRGDEGAPEAPEQGPGGDPVWKVEGEETMDKMLNQTSPSSPEYDGGGMMIYTDEHGQRRRLPTERGTMDSRDLRAAARALQADLGGPKPDFARAAVLDRLSELRASGRMSEEDYEREKKRLEGYGK